MPTVLALAGTLAAQLRIDGDVSALAALAARARRAVAPLPTADGPAAARTLFAALRLGDADTARMILRAADAFAMADPEAGPGDAWRLVAHATYIRVTGDSSLARDAVAGMSSRLDALEDGGPPTTWAAGAMTVHARYCLASILDAIDREDHASRWRSNACDQRPGAAHERRASASLVALECRTWQPGRGHYRPHATSGELLVPETADGSLLLPCSSGMLVATGDRMTRHLRSVLACAADGRPDRWQRGELEAEQPALRLFAATQLGDPAARDTAWRDLIRRCEQADSPAALDFDAAMFAVTGLCLAAGARDDQRLMRLSPWLPEPHRHLALTGMLANGREVDVTCRRDAPGGPLEIRVAVHDLAGLGPLQLVIADVRRQIITRLEPGRPFACTLQTGGGG